MDDEVPRLPDAPEPEGDESEGDEPAVPLPSLPPEVTTGDEELRALIAAGASTPEELRDLAAQIRAHREREDELWRNEVRPALKKAKKGRFRLSDLVDRPEARTGPSGVRLALGVVGAVSILVLAATQSSILWVLLPLIAVLVFAYRQGKRGEPAAEPPPTVEDVPD